MPSYHEVLQTGTSAGIGGLVLGLPSICGSRKNLSDIFVSICGDVSFGSLDKPQLMKMTHINELTLIKFHNEAITGYLVNCR